MAKSIMCLTILVLLTIAEAGNALLIGNQVVSGLLVTGAVCCSPNGLCGGTDPPITNSEVFLVANNIVIAVGKVGPAGQVLLQVFDLGLLGSVIGIANLVVRIPVPIFGCAILSSVNGFLQGPVIVVGSVVNGVVTVALGPLTLITF